MSPIKEKERIKEFYEDVRNNSTGTNWALLTYDGDNIIPLETGEDFEDFKSHFTSEERFYGYLRIETGDEMSKRSKFVFITWVGTQVSMMKQAKVSTDKNFVRDILTNYAVEVFAQELSEVSYDTIADLVKKAGGANYGTGRRD
ncbi:coactosin-like protein [Octopus bimaculoides]|uniref:Coactosin-like protein n=1 Tax=Octopus bimaculoides TaxID=37653 RepID=A0A0L8H3X2_OCTBM|nr:coactosin-like protein [Octopus bimaculoides]|eukprot:XP_014775659.1 PREDICTED: coactosin-like protein [Octopus bimaculoides]